MAQVDAELYFTIEEKTNQIELTERGIQTLSDQEDQNFFVLPDIGGEIAAIERKGLTARRRGFRKGKTL